MGAVISISPEQKDEADKPRKTFLIKPGLIAATFGFKPIKVEAPRRKNKPAEPERAEDVQKTRPSQASTAELLLCLGRFLRRRCWQIPDLTSNEAISWFRNVDRALLLQGWQEESFITAPSLVFLYLLCRDAVSEGVAGQDELRGVFLTCLYLTYSYLGAEISYPLRPFVIAANEDVFWTQALGVVDKLGSEMLRINMEPRFYTALLEELSNDGRERNTIPNGSSV